MSGFIGIVMATQVEADPFINCLKLSEKIQKPFKIYDRSDAALVISGIGKANAAMASIFLDSRYSPDVIFNFGAAGALKKDFSLGRVYQVKKGLELDRPCLKDGRIRYFNAYPLEGFDDAILATQDRAVIDPMERKELSSIADIVDMEAGAIAQASKKINIPCFIFKFISDTPDDYAYKDIISNIETYREDFALFIKENVLKSRSYLRNFKN